LLVAQLSKHSSRKACTKPDSLEKFLEQKLGLFLDDDQSRTNFMGKEPTIGPSFLAINQDYEHVDNSPIQKVIVLTLVINEPLEYDEKWPQIKKILVNQLEAVSKAHKGVLLALNIHCNGARIKNFKYDRINENSWREWATSIASAQTEDDRMFSDIL
jgi:hypothetical protein